VLAWDSDAHGRLEIKEIIRELGRAGDGIYTSYARSARYRGRSREENDNVNSPRSRALRIFTETRFV
jgi:hypothetical protein